MVIWKVEVLSLANKKRDRMLILLQGVHHSKCIVMFIMVLSVFKACSLCDNRTLDVACQVLIKKVGS